MKAVNINGLNKSQNTNIAKTERTEQKPEEIMLFGASTSKSMEAQGKIRRTAIKSYKGNIGDKKVDVVERNKIVSMTNLRKSYRQTFYSRGVL